MKTIRHELKASITRAVKAEAKTRNEVTGRVAASIAGRMSRKIQKSMKDKFHYVDDHSFVYFSPLAINLGTVAELQTVLASALTQTKDRQKKGAKK